MMLTPAPIVGAAAARRQRTAHRPHWAAPAGQLYHAAGPTEGGYLVAAVWDSKETFGRFVEQALMPALPTIEGGFTGAPQERTCEVSNLVTG